MSFIFDNIIFALQQGGGISAYWSELLRRIIRDGLSFKVVEHPKSALNIFRKKLEINPALLINERPLPIWLSRYLPYSVPRGSRCICHSSYYRVPERNSISVVTVHDFIYERFYRGAARLVHSIQKRAAVKAASGIICVSNSTKRDLLKFYPEVSVDKIRVIYHGVSECYRPLESVNRRFLFTDFPGSPFILYVGGRSSYKNFYFALESIASLPAYWLVSVGGGKLNRKEADLSKKFLSCRHLHLPAVDNERLNQLYNCAHALLYPSSYEGFGIPIIEAMKAGCPVIAVNSSAIPEACGDAGLLVNEIKAEKFVAQILKLENIVFRKEIINKGYAQAKRFSWENCYRETISFYNKITKEKA
jgi:mannosyltransferase